MSTQHTPGPWYVQGPLADWESGTPGGVPRRVVAAHEDGRSAFSITDDLSEADANLIAAAPDLLDVAKAALAIHTAECEDPDGSRCSLTRVLRAAIAKTEGREHTAS